ncbi:MAG: division/cell wall cluster transcriptional repressor MraZ [Thermoleophilia bacterium]|nr:division/cell wall cluster transcriptional repressor MraZ [Thermoleophilia bacterium]
MRAYTSRLDSRGYLYLPASLRKTLNLEPGEGVIFLALPGPQVFLSSTQRWARFLDELAEMLERQDTRRFACLSLFASDETPAAFVRRLYRSSWLATVDPSGRTYVAKDRRSVARLSPGRYAVAVLE